MKVFKILLLPTFENQCISGLYALKIHVPDDNVKVFEKFRRLSVLDSSTFELLNVHIK